jgi:hypothetical protein
VAVFKGLTMKTSRQTTLSFIVAFLTLHNAIGSLAFVPTGSLNRPELLINPIKFYRTVPYNPTTTTVSTSTTSLHYSMWNQDDRIHGKDRIKACVPYFLPIIDGDQFGHFLYDRCGQLGAVSDFVVGPLLNIQAHVPFLCFILFSLFTIGTHFNTDISRNVRFSAVQAALIDFCLLFAMLIGSCFEQNPLPRNIAEPCSNFVFYAYATAIVYSTCSNLTGKRPDQIPLISEAADLLVGPF